MKEPPWRESAAAAFLRAEASTATGILRLAFASVDQPRLFAFGFGSFAQAAIARLGVRMIGSGGNRKPA